jgi:hypothetical protein
MGRAGRNRVLGPYEFFLAFLDCESQLLAQSRHSATAV